MQVESMLMLNKRIHLRGFSLTRHLDERLFSLVQEILSYWILAFYNRPMYLHFSSRILCGRSPKASRSLTHLYLANRCRRFGTYWNRSRNPIPLMHHGRISRMTNVYSCIHLDPQVRDYLCVREIPSSRLTLVWLGPPKLINYTHAAISCTDNDPNIPVPDGRRPQNASLFMFDSPSRYYSCFPAFHVSS